MIQQTGGCRPLFWIFNKAYANKIDEFSGPFVRFAEGRRRLRGYHEYCPHRMDVAVWWFAFGHLQGGNPQTPYVRHAVVADLLDHLWRHPKRCAYNNNMKMKKKRNKERENEKSQKRLAAYNKSI